MNKPDAVSYGIEHIPELVAFSKKNINKKFGEYLKSGNVVIVEGDGRMGLPEYQPYDIIHVGAGLKMVLAFKNDSFLNFQPQKLFQNIWQINWLQEEDW